MNFFSKISNFNSKMATIEVNNTRISVKCKYDSMLCDFFNKQPKFFYDYETKLWSFPKERMAPIKEFLTQAGYEVSVVDKQRYSTVQLYDGKVRIELGSHFKGFDSLRDLPGYKYQMRVVYCDGDQLDRVKQIMNENGMPVQYKS
jgi:hypothetical protein